MNLAILTLLGLVILASAIGVYRAFTARVTTAKPNHAWIKGCLCLVALMGVLVWANEREQSEAIWMIGLGLLAAVPFVAYLVVHAFTRWLLGRDKVVPDGAL